MSTRACVWTMADTLLGACGANIPHMWHHTPSPAETHYESTLLLHKLLRLPSYKARLVEGATPRQSSQSFSPQLSCHDDPNHRHHEDVTLASTRLPRWPFEPFQHHTVPHPCPCTYFFLGRSLPGQFFFFFKQKHFDCLLAELIFVRDPQNKGKKDCQRDIYVI